MIRLVVAVTALTLAGAAAGQDMDFFSIGSGSVSGNYFASAHSICDDVNRADTGNLRCSPEPTNGSLYNLKMLREGELALAYSQSDLQRQALEGTGPFASDGPDPALRSVASLYSETVTVLARPELAIKAGSDLFGRRVDIGPPASGRHASLQVILDQTGFDRSHFTDLLELTTDRAITELCAERIDATVLIVGHPSRDIARALSTCDLELAPFSGPAIDGLLGSIEEYAPTTINAGTYPGQTQDISSYAVLATVVTHAGTEDRLVRAFTLAALKQIVEMAELIGVSREEALQAARRGLSAPMHPAAEAAFELMARDG